MRAWVKQHFPAVDRFVDRFGYWGAFFVAIWFAMSWIANSISGLAQYGWGAVVFAGLAVALLASLGVTGSLALYRYFNPLPPRPSPPPPSADVIGEDSTAIGSFAAGLFAAEMQVSTTALENDRYIQISARCFNATGHIVFLDKVEGQICVSESGGGSSKETMKLPPPMLIKQTFKSSQIGDKEGFVVLLEQRIPNDLVDKIMAVTFDQSVGLDFHELSVMVTSHSNFKLSARLPLWDGISLRRWPQTHIWGNRVVALSIPPTSIKLGAGQ